jgi:hypothetical protein
MDTRAFYVCLDARPSNVSLLRRLVTDHLKTAGLARSTAQETQATVVRSFSEAVEGRYPDKKMQIEVEIHHDPDPSVAVRERN